MRLYRYSPQAERMFPLDLSDLWYDVRASQRWGYAIDPIYLQVGSRRLRVYRGRRMKRKV